MKNLDKFYTKDDIAKQCYDRLNSELNVQDKLFLEPSAGGGSFINYLNNYEAYDIKPEDSRIKQLDFLTFESNYIHYITLGNPPFGQRSKLAIQFFNKCALYSDVIAFIVPISFLKYNVQKELDNNFKLISNWILPEYSFTDRDKDFDVNCVFQIWVKKHSEYDTKQRDLRIYNRPPVSYPDFELWQYNACDDSLNVINRNWTLATYRQGYHDYNQLFTQSDKDYIWQHMTADKRQQFFFIRPKNKDIEDRIKSLDFNKLAQRNTSTPGFGKADFIAYYIEHFDLY